MSYDLRQNAREAVELDPLRRAWERHDREELGRIFRATMVAQDAETCSALLRGESVPVDRCDRRWIEKFGLRIRR